ncbi:MAG TPA: YlxR family protein [Gaiella sp.]|nr:YlxR family protein [Gaiella sp.]
MGCGRRAPQEELVRFTEVDGVLSEGRTASGRGAYTCRNAACFEQAVRRGAFPRALGTPLHIEPELTRLYTEGSHG